MMQKKPFTAAVRAESSMGTKFTAMAMALRILTVWSTARADENSKFNTWLANLRSEALQSGIRTDIADAALSSIQPLPRVIELDRKQPEFTMTFDEYLGNVVPRSRVIKGLNKLAENRELLTKIGAQYGVQPRFIVAFWGIETDFGRHTGGFSVINALATLAFDGRRSAYFRKELLNALQILNDGHIAPNDMKGSWAGAMGQCQFMPSSFLNFAVDNDGDGRRDIWTTKADVFASAANYLSQSGWRGDQTWGRQVSLPKNFDTALANLDTVKVLNEWQLLGVRRVNGADLPTRPLMASLVLPERKAAPASSDPGDNEKSGASPAAYLVYDNYRATLKWNRSTFFAMAVGHLADAIGRR